MHKEGEEACAFRVSDLDTKLFCLVTSDFSFSSHSLLFVHTVFNDKCTKRAKRRCALRVSDLDTKLFGLVTSNFSFSSHLILSVHTFFNDKCIKRAKRPALLEYLGRAAK